MMSDDRMLDSEPV